MTREIKIKEIRFPTEEELTQGITGTVQGLTQLTDTNKYYVVISTDDYDYLLPHYQILNAYKRGRIKDGDKVRIVKKGMRKISPSKSISVFDIYLIKED